MIRPSGDMLWDSCLQNDRKREITFSGTDEPDHKCLDCMEWQSTPACWLLGHGV